jgi:MFS family permease
MTPLFQGAKSLITPPQTGSLFGAPCMVHWATPPAGCATSLTRLSGDRYGRVILAPVLLAQFLSPLVAFSLGALAPLLRDALALTREQVGSLAAFFYAGTALGCLPAGWAADRLGARPLLMVAHVLGGLALLTVPRSANRGITQRCGPRGKAIDPRR